MLAPFLLLLPLHLGALEAPAAPPLLEAQTHEYFDGEQRESYLWMGLGVAGLGCGVGGLLTHSDGGRGAAIPCFGLGLLQLALGVGLWVRTPPQVDALDAVMGRDAHAFLLQEGARMERVNAGFRVYRVVELSTLLGGAATASFGHAFHNDLSVGMGLGLAAESVVMLILDHFADDRAALYAQRLGVALGP